MIDKHNQCRTTYQDYTIFKIRQLCKTLTPEARQHVAEQIQARISFGGERPISQEAYEQAMKLLKGEKL